MSKKSHIYFQIYEKIEEEVLNLSSSIHFVDDQLEVYSIKIADLIVRCSIEVESLIKDIYDVESGEKYVNIGESLKWLEKHWKISKKTVNVYSNYFHLSNNYMEFAPFNYEKYSKDDYYSIYNAIKHDRSKNLCKANLYTLFRILGALFILNIYFQDERIYLEDFSRQKKIDMSRGSKIFNFYVSPCKDLIKLTNEEDIDREICLYEINRRENGYMFVIEYLNRFDEKETIKMIMGMPIFQEFAKSSLGNQIDLDIFNKFMSQLTYNNEKYFLNEFQNTHKINKILSVTPEKMKSSYWMELVKGD